ncbi:MAG: NUDIX domain-containing protein, partial [Muribaculaceae bacterium]|nr:NUDIX domain-containing protein [Muribaculaceae bacterium]
MKELLITGNSKILLMNDNGKLRLPTSEEIALSSDIETFDFQNYVAANLSEVTDLPEGSIVYGLRESWEILPPEKYTAATKGAELVNWSESEKFCSRDGEKLQRASQISKCCPRCGREYFPRLNPAIVVLVLKGSEALLVHAHTLKNPDVLTLVAGYVETGESLEECVRREIKEETNLDVSDVKYFGSPAWPF